MRSAIFKRLAAFAFMATSACATPDPELAVLVDGTRSPLPPGYGPAWIVEIAAHRVAPQRGSYFVRPGVTSVGLTPVTQGPPDQVPLTAGANRPGEVIYMEVDVAPGRRYVLALREDLSGEPVGAIVREESR